MQKLFTLIRQGKFEEVKQIIEKKPQEVNCVSGPKPKKDHGQSPLQVALKIGNFRIADYLVEHGADINFMEAEDDDPGVRTPVLFDAINVAVSSLYYKSFDVSEEAVKFVKRLIELGADVNKTASNGFDAIEWAIFNSELMFDRPTVYVDSQEAVRKQLAAILDILIENGADYVAWANRCYHPDTLIGPSNKNIYLDESDSDAKAEIRAFLQEYFRSRNLTV